MNIFSGSYSFKKIPANTAKVTETLNSRRMILPSSDRVSFKGTVAQGAGVKLHIDPQIMNRVLNMLKEHDFKPLEFVDNNNQMLYSLKFIRTMGNLYLSYYEYKDNEITKFDSAVANRSYNVDEKEMQKLFPGSEPITFKLWDNGVLSRFMFDGAKSESFHYNDSESIHKTEDILLQMLSDIESKKIQPFHANIESSLKHYDDFNRIHSKQFKFKKALKALSSQSDQPPSYRQISEWIDGHNAFLHNAEEAKALLQMKEQLKRLPDDKKYAIALERQKTQINNQRGNMPVAGKTEKPSAKVYQFYPEKPKT